MRDKVAIVGVGITPYGRSLRGRTALSLGMEACRLAIEDAGLTRKDIDGICGTSICEFEDIQEGMGIPQITWSLNTMRGTIPPHQVAAAAYAVFSGACDTALVVHGHTRGPGSSKSAANDPYRTSSLVQSQARNPPRSPLDLAAFWAHSADPYGAFGGRYLWQYNVPRDVYGLIAVNNRTNATMNPHAVMQTPITMDDYLAARMIREPLCMLDMDLPVDGGNALVITTAERARDLAKKPVYIHASTFGENRYGTHYYEQAEDYEHLSNWICMRALWERSELQLKDMDIFFPYDGFTNISITWIESSGYCGPGEAYDFLREQWVADENRLKIDGKVVFSPNGGSLSDGASQGFNYFHESVVQLRGEAGRRQVPGARTSLVAAGGIFHNSTALVLRTD